MEMRVDLAVATGLAVAGLAGLAVGIEREWSGHATGPAARFAGVRTFLLLGLLGGLAGWLIDGGLMLPGALLLASGSLLTVAAYVTHPAAGEPAPRDCFGHGACPEHAEGCPRNDWNARS